MWFIACVCVCVCVCLCCSVEEGRAEVHVYDGRGSGEELAHLDSLHHSPILFLQVGDAHRSPSLPACGPHPPCPLLCSTIPSTMWSSQQTRVGCSSTGVAPPMPTPSPPTLTSSTRQRLTCTSLPRASPAPPAWPTPLMGSCLLPWQPTGRYHYQCIHSPTHVLDTLSPLWCVCACV